MDPCLTSRGDGLTIEQNAIPKQGKVRLAMESNGRVTVETAPTGWGVLRFGGCFQGYLVSPRGGGRTTCFSLLKSRAIHGTAFAGYSRSDAGRLDA